MVAQALFNSKSNIYKIKPATVMQFEYFSSPSPIHLFISYIFISNTRLELAKNQANPKQHPESELCYICRKIYVTEFTVK